MKRVGVITHYYHSLNYGGVLQAYALCRMLRQYDMEPEQICFPLSGRPLPWQERKSGNRILRFLKDGVLIRKAAHRIKRNVEKMTIRLLIPDLAKKRRAAFSHFVNELIPHSPAVYDNTNIGQCSDRYDIFITGSDQVWNLRWYNPAYFLAFADEKKPKFSYGASVSMSVLSPQEKELFCNHLRDFIGVSVREPRAAEMLAEATAQNVEVVLDPTLLLTQEQWNEVCAPRQVEGAYVFCYFLGKGRKQRRLAKAFAKKRKLKLVTIPHMENQFITADVSFGDVRLPNPSPEEFLSLIRYAACVFTDSFHATVFASLYQKEHYTFCRAGHKGMDSRIHGLTELFGTGARFCDTPEKLKLEHLLQCKPLDYSAPTPGFDAMKKQSLDYLSRMLDTAKEMIDNHEK